MIQLVNRRIFNSSGNLISADFRFDDEMKSSVPVVVFSHGFKSFKDWGFIPYVCEQFAQSGFIAVNFDFSFNGISDPVAMRYDEAMFSQNTVSQEIADLNTVLDFLYKELKNTVTPFPTWNGMIYLAGHSLGGAVSLFTASKRNDIAGVVTWAAVSQINRNTERQKKIWKEQGFAEVKIQQTGQILKLNYSYLLDKDTNFSQNAVLDACKSIQCPVLVLHGRIDITVKLAEAYEIYDAVKHINNSEINVIEHTGHTFGARHPLEEPARELIEATSKTIEFFKL
ncbi:MAG: alpha/beta hydrolase [Desulfobulbaceae bacterium]|nr:alpha/beta hydrolase [Desulfobulbaceae bacterium]MBS4001303.1 alpha/beta hydrolase [Desulfobulbaceae bacterium]